MRPDDNALAPDKIGQNSSGGSANGSSGNNGQISGEADQMADNTKNDDMTTTENETQQADAPETAQTAQATEPEATQAEPQAEETTDAEAATNHTADAADNHAVPALDQDDHTVQDFHDDADSDSDETDMSAMARLLDEEETQFKSIKRGDVVEGQIVHMDDDEILVDIGLKSEGVLSIKELPPTGYGSREELHVGDNVLVYVVQPETPEGHAIVSIKRARLERQWRIAQEQYERGELLEAEVIDFNKGGLIVNLDGIRGFVPISQILNLKREDNSDNAETQQKLQAMVGRTLQLKIIEINRNRNRLILSERLAVQEWRARRREELLNELEVGEVRTGTVSNLANFGAFVDLGGADGLVHISQLAWSRVNHPSEVLKVGQKVEVQVLSVDKEKKKIALSIKRAEVDPWTTVESRYHVGQLVQGTITKIAPFGAFARIEDGVEGLIHISELPAGVSDPKQVLHEGEEVTVRILRIETERRRLGLSIRQAGEEATAEAAPSDAGEAVAGATPEAGEATANGATEAVPTEAAAGRQRPERPQQQQQPRREEPPTTAMAAAFAAASRRDQAPESPEAEAPEAPAQPAAEAAATETPAPEATADTLAPETPTPETPADEVPPDAHEVAAAEAGAAEAEQAEAESTPEATASVSPTAGDEPAEGSPAVGAKAADTASEPEGASES